MDFQLDDDQRALRAGVRELLAGRFPRERLRAAVDDPAVDRALWRELGAAGFFNLRLAVADGGAGLGLPEAVIVFEEAGRALLPGPLVATHLAAGTVPGAAAGEAVVTAVEAAGDVAAEAADEAPGKAGPAATATDAGAGSEYGSDAGAGSVLVAHLADASDVLILAGDRLLRADAAHFTPATPVRPVDPLTPLARTVVVTGKAAVAVHSPDFRRDAGLLTAAQQCGNAARTLELAVEYARTRQQFGRPIGTFQAVKHMCAEMLVRSELARTALYAAAVTGDALETAAAKLLCDEAALRNARDCLQVFGGMGFTWEADVHLHLKRAWVLARQWTRAADAEEALAAAIA